MKDYAIGKYRILEEIASGPSGRVYRGADSTRNNAPVAVKLLHSANLGSQQERDQFLQEARSLMQLKHPNILPVLDAGFERELPYIVMEFVPNGSLLDYLKKLAPRPLPTPEALRIIIQVGQALQYAHQHNIIHRDLKPNNILFGASGEALLTDFGIATLLTNSMKHGTVISTPFYMAPEQFRGDSSKEGDQYAIGCITYELVTGRRPFNAADFFTLGSKHMSETPMQPTQLNMLLSRSLEQVILKAMAKKRNDRYPSVAAYIGALGGGTQLFPTTTYAQSQSPSPPLPVFPASPPPVAIINATTLPSATSSVQQKPVFTPQTQSVQQWGARDIRNGVDNADDETFIKPIYSEAEFARLQLMSAPSLPPPPTTQPPVMRMDKSTSARPFSPADSLPRALNAASASINTPPSAQLPQLPYQPSPIQAPLYQSPQMQQMQQVSPQQTPSQYYGQDVSYETVPMLTNDNSMSGIVGQGMLSSMLPPSSQPMTPVPAIPPIPMPPPQSGNAGALPITGPAIYPLTGKRPRNRKRKLLIGALILLIVLLIASLGLFASLKVFGSRQIPTLSTATVTIIPAHPTHVGTYTLTAVTGTPVVAALQVQARMLTATVQQTHTVTSSGVGDIPATAAHGSLTFYNDSTSPQPFSAGMIYTGSDGVQVVNTQSGVIPPGNPNTVPLTWGGVTISARVVKAGRAGNIAANDVNVWKANGTKSFFVVQNKSSFSGGRDAVYYPVVQQSDLTSAVTPWTMTVLRNAKSAASAQVQANQQSAASTRCIEHTAYNHQVSDHAATLSATITATCTLEVYDRQGAIMLATSLLRNRLMASGGAVLLPFFAASVVQSQVLNNQGTISLLVKAFNTEFSNAQLQNMAGSIVGKNSQDAQTTLLHLKGVAQVTIHINGGDGQTLPTDATRITVILAS